MGDSIVPCSLNFPASAKATGRKTHSAAVLAILVLWLVLAGGQLTAAQQAPPAGSATGADTALDHGDVLTPDLTLGDTPPLRSDPENFNELSNQGSEDDPRPLSREELELLHGLGEEGLGLPSTRSSTRRQSPEDQALEDLKSLLREIDPRDNLSLDLPVTLEDSAPVGAAPGSQSASSSPGGPSSSGGTGGFSGTAGSSQGAAAGGEPRGTIGDIGDLLLGLVSDLRLYAYLLLSLGFVLGGFGLVALLRWSREKKRRQNRRGHHSRRSHGRMRSKRRRGSRRRLAHP